MFLYSVGPSRIDQVTQCDLLHVTAYVTARVQILLCCCIHRHSKKVRFISFLPSDMMQVHFASRKVAKKQGPKCQFQKDVKSRCII